MRGIAPLIAALLLASLAAPATVAAAGTVTVTPSSGLNRAGHTVQVDGAGWVPSSVVLIQQMTANPNGGLWVTPLATVNVPVSGTFSWNVTVHYSLGAENFPCDAPECWVRVHDSADTVDTPITFAAAAAPTLTVTPSTDLTRAGQQVTVAGANWPAGDDIQIQQLRTGLSQALGANVIVSANGSWSAVRNVVYASDPEQIPCDAPVCAIRAVGNQSNIDLNTPITFAAVTPPPSGTPLPVGTPTTVNVTGTNPVNLVVTNPNGSVPDTVTVVEQPAAGSVTVNPDKSMTYTPLSFGVDDSFDYQAQTGATTSPVTTITMRVAALAPEPRSARSQETRWDAAYERSLTRGSWRVAMWESSNKGSSGNTWDDQSEIYIRGNTYAWYHVKNANGNWVRPYGICFWDYYTAQFAASNAATAPFTWNVFANATTVLHSGRRTNNGRTITLELRTCTTGSIVARNPGGGNYEIGVHCIGAITSGGCDIDSITHRTSGNVYLTQSQWNQNKPAYSKVITDTIGYD